MTDIAGRVLDRLAEGHDARFAEPYFAYPAAVALGLPLVAIYEALWTLLGRGLVYLDPSGQGSSSWDNWNWRLTEAGREVTRSGAWAPRDPDRYLARLEQRAPELDKRALVYVTEALRAFNARCFLSSSVMLGVAAERVFEQLAAAFVAAYPSETAALRKLLEADVSSQARLWSEFRKRLEPRRPELPDGLGDSLTLDAVAELLRVTRNAAGHPTGRTIDEDTASTHIAMAASLLAKMTDLTEHFRQHSALRTT